MKIMKDKFNIEETRIIHDIKETNIIYDELNIEKI